MLARAAPPLETLEGRAKILGLSHTAQGQLHPLQAEAGPWHWGIAVATALWGWHYHHWFMNEETEAQRGAESSLRSQ